MPIYHVECYETVRLVREIEVPEEVEETPAFFSSLIAHAQRDGSWEEESMGTESNRVYRVDDGARTKEVFDEDAHLDAYMARMETEAKQEPAATSTKGS